MENGAFYLTTRTLLENTGSRLGGTITVYEMPEDTAAEIDEPADWVEIERLLLRRVGQRPSDERHGEGSLTTRLRNLSWFFVDVDGTLTDGGMYYSAEGEALKRFNTRDAAGLRRLRERGINVGIITSEDSEIARARAAKLRIETVFTGVADKAATLRTFAADHHLELAHIGLVGDDLNDLPAMQILGFAACPADAVPEVRAAADLVATARGGHGAVREVCEGILHSLVDPSL
jgi:N-acylneuraminate cytidylyltransferase